VNIEAEPGEGARFRQGGEQGQAVFSPRNADGDFIAALYQVKFLTGAPDISQYFSQGLIFSQL
jgi:hypothetical protein